MKSCIYNARPCACENCTNKHRVRCCGACQEECENRCRIDARRRNNPDRGNSTCYISGPIRGNDRAEYDFQEAAVMLATAGYLPVNPHEIMEPVADALSRETIIQADLEILGGCDCVLFLPGWEKSEGCRKEHDKAVRTRKKKYYLRGGEMKQEDGTISGIKTEDKTT